MLNRLLFALAFHVVCVSQCFAGHFYEERFLPDDLPISSWNVEVWDDGGNYYIRPTQTNIEAWVIYKLEIGARITQSLISINNLIYDPHSWIALDVSPNGVDWTNLETKGLGDVTHDFEVGGIVYGSNEIWLRGRMFAANGANLDDVRFFADRPIIAPMFVSGISVPEPSSLIGLILGMGLVCCGSFRWR